MTGYRECSHLGCVRHAPHGLGRTHGEFRWYCADHWQGAFVRLIALLQGIGVHV